MGEIRSVACAGNANDCSAGMQTSFAFFSLTVKATKSLVSKKMLRAGQADGAVAAKNLAE